MIDDDVELLWDYLSTGVPLVSPVDAAVALGCHDVRVAQHAARLVQEGRAPVLVVSGGIGKDTPPTWGGTEAAYFAQVARRQGLPAHQVLLEESSTNTGENIDFSRRLLSESGIATRSVVLITKPYMQRRAVATAALRWPGVKVFTSSPPVSLQDYLSGAEAEAREFLNLLVGDLQRMRIYAQRGFQAEQVVPDEVWSAFERLLEAGYRKYAITA